MKEKIELIKSNFEKKNFNEIYSIIASIPEEEKDISGYLKLSNFLTKNDYGAKCNFPKIKIALLANNTVDHLIPLLKISLLQEKMDPIFFVSAFDTIEQTILDINSELYDFHPDIVWIFYDFRNETSLPEEKAKKFQNLWKILQGKLPCSIIQNNAVLPLIRSWGNYEISYPGSITNTMRSINSKLMELVESGTNIFDMDGLSNIYGKQKWFSENYWYHSKHSFDLDAGFLVSHCASKLISSIKGKSKKCIVLDLDNTLWGGIIGDDGLEGIKLGDDTDGEAFLDFQNYILSLKQRGIILAVCSKNEEENAMLPFQQHPRMAIKLEDISVFRANWASKSDNIKFIAETLNLGLDSFVFLDDNPVERNNVRTFLPEVTVIEMPEDPSYYIRALDSARLFETTTFSDEDLKRSSMYQENRQRESFKENYKNQDDFLVDLDMKSHTDFIDTFHLPRSTQLINKSNQFHLTTTRYTEAQIKEMSTNPNYRCRFFKLRDRFGDNGLISVVIANLDLKGNYAIDTWVMSCRVLSRGMEDFIFSKILDDAFEVNAKCVIGTYIPTPKNKLVSGLYNRLGFKQTSATDTKSIWEFPLSNSPLKKACFIKNVNKQNYEGTT